MRLDHVPERKIMVPSIDRLVDRREEPQVRTLFQAVEWVVTKKPILWIGSIFSVPQPSGLPAGAATTRAILDLIYPPDERISPSFRDRVIQEAQTRFSLEQLMDYMEVLYDPKFPASVLDHFSRLNSKARPNSLHDAVVKYYEMGLSSAPVCFTTNWDTLLERAFRNHGYTAHVGSFTQDLGESFGRDNSKEKAIWIYHPHGSFETRDTVSSAFQEQQQLPMPYSYLHQPILFLGYSGYEPSMYPHLDWGNPQLWCIRQNGKNLGPPAKQRLLCKPNTYVFVGDVCKLLKELGVLDADVDCSQQVKPLVLKSKLLDLAFDPVRNQIKAIGDPLFATDLLLETQLLGASDPNAGIKTHMTIQAIDGHIRNRVHDHRLPLALMAARFYPFPEQIWISLIGYLLRHSQDESGHKIAFALGQIYQIEKEHQLTGPLKDTRIMRILCYKKFLGLPDAIQDDDLYLKCAMIGQGRAGDMALGGELSELAGFHYLRDGDDNRAKAYFDSAATYYYLTGLWQGGEQLEWASRNLDQVRVHAAAKSLYIPFNEAIS